LLARRTSLSIALATVGLLASGFVARAPVAHANEPEVAVSLSVSAARPALAPAAPGAGAAAELIAPAPLAFDRWRGLSFGTYLAPASDFVAPDGGVDVVFHFHAGQMAEKELKASGVNAVFVSCGFGIGSGAYSAALASPQRFQRMLDELVKNLEKETGKKGLHVRKLALASWSAGFAAVGKILGVDRYYAMIDTVILNDSLHAQYVGPNPKVDGYSTSRGAERVDLNMLRSFVRFAKDAAAGTKSMTITHSAIIPPDYASSAEATDALLTAVDVSATLTRPEDEAPSPVWRGMTLTKRADSGNLHVRGFRGRGPRDHFEHLHLIGEVLRSSVVVRWKREDRLVYTLAGEQL
jgi:hypothetical protein